MACCCSSGRNGHRIRQAPYPGKDAPKQVSRNGYLRHLEGHVVSYFHSADIRFATIGKIGSVTAGVSGRILGGQKIDGPAQLLLEISAGDPRVTQAGLDESDLAAAMGITPLPDHDPFVYARGRLVVEATAAGVQPIGVHYPMGTQPSFPSSEDMLKI
ncbi:MAG: hypothetical protein IH787_03610, partial [Nitrospirae bacterium]|nr:hypothetical protein [Nitrospirota bacterium]